MTETPNSLATFGKKSLNKKCGILNTDLEQKKLYEIVHVKPDRRVSSNFR